VRALLDELPWLVGVAHRRSSDQHLADDLVQQVYLRALQLPPLTRDPRAIRAWLTSVLRSLAFDRSRGEARRRWRERWSARAEDSTEETWEKVSREQERGRIRSAVESLREPYRSTIRFRYIDGLSSPEIAARQGVSPALVRQRVSRGLRQLKQGLSVQAGSFQTGLLLLLALPGRIRNASLLPLALASTAVLLFVSGASWRLDPRLGGGQDGIRTAPSLVNSTQTVLTLAVEENSAPASDAGLVGESMGFAADRAGSYAPSEMVELPGPSGALGLAGDDRFGRDGDLWRRGKDGSFTLLVGASGKFRDGPQDRRYPPGAIWFTTYREQGATLELLSAKSWPPRSGVPAGSLPGAEELFGLRLDVIGDLDGNGIPEIAVGAPRSFASGADRFDGAV